jgi:Domain of unknown function (DUF4279)
MSVAEQSPAPYIKVFFAYSGKDLDVDSISAHLGIKPTGIWRQKHEHILRDNPELPNTNWLYEIEDLRLYSTNEAIEELLKVIWPIRESVVSYNRLSGLVPSITCTVKIYEDRPLYEVLPQNLQRMGYLGCEFGLDIYDYTE